jgi:hydrogenase expression/formation protein HypE
MGLDPLQMACEGRVVLLAEPEAARRALAAFRQHEQGADAAIIGQVSDGSGTAVHTPRVVLQTAMGGRRLITTPASDPLPRIC